jgi:hypothetical protein
MRRAWSLVLDLDPGSGSLILVEDESTLMI